MTDAHDRTERPTPRRLERARLEGRLPQSPLAGAALAAFLFGLPVLAVPNAIGGWVTLMRATALCATDAATASTSTLHLWSSWHGDWTIVATAGGAAIAGAIAASAASGVLGFSPLALQPRLARLSARVGITQLVGLQGLLHAGGGTLAVGFVCWAAAPTVRTLVEIASAGASLSSEVAEMGVALEAMWLRIAFLLGLLAVVDVCLTRRRAIAALRMTPREIKEERAEVEGRPETRARRRAYAAGKARDVQVGEIRKASAVVVNPTHVAVALRYAPPAIDVPIVVSRGADLAALVVRSVAALHDIPVVESPGLARSLYARLLVGQAIPEDCYAAVAAVFAWLIRTRGSLAGSERDA